MTREFNYIVDDYAGNASILQLCASGIKNLFDLKKESGERGTLTVSDENFEGAQRITLKYSLDFVPIVRTPRGRRAQVLYQVWQNVARQFGMNPFPNSSQTYTFFVKFN